MLPELSTAAAAAAAPTFSPKYAPRRMVAMYTLLRRKKVCKAGATSSRQGRAGIMRIIGPLAG